MALGQKGINLWYLNLIKQWSSLKWKLQKRLAFKLQLMAIGVTMPSGDNGAVGGHMVRKMIEDYERRLSGKTPTQ